MSLFLGSGLGKFVGLRGLHSGTTWKYGHLVRLCQRWVGEVSSNFFKRCGAGVCYRFLGQSGVIGLLHAKNTDAVCNKRAPEGTKTP